ncbi:MFS transporter [Paludibacterium purpuratum]|uniref:Putative MFS family arabinose efflux permease n=1 Tax=Paludibacterium purpuratum TaxID=1144873 RepID=A0A4R7AYZ0_9NEIS|nr:MFS transporter [Paludibacterium purpuratum]TDR73333.1 putative MFS family arabinose efflux permease [Paludibacterium purpuratum]
MSRSWLLVGWVTIFLVGTDLFVVAPFLPGIGQDLHRQASSLTMLISIFSIVYAIACPIQARFAERFGVGNVLLFGILTLGLANLYTALAQDLPNLLLSRGLAGLAAASISPMIYALTANRTRPEERAGKLALINSGLVIALILGAPLGLVLGAHSGWRPVFALLALAFLLVWPVNKMTWQSEIGGGAAKGKSATEHLSSAWVFFLCMICWAASVYATYTLLSSAMSNEYHVSEGDLALVLTSYGVGAALGGILGGKLADRIGASSMVRLAFSLMIVTLLLLTAVYQTHQLGWLSLNLFLLALVAYGFFPALQACAAQIFVTRRPTVMGLLSSCLYIGITLGSSVGGKLFTAGGMALVQRYSIAMAVLGLILSMFIRGKRRA